MGDSRHAQNRGYRHSSDHRRGRRSAGNHHSIVAEAHVRNFRHSLLTSTLRSFLSLRFSGPMANESRSHRLSLQNSSCEFVGFVAGKVAAGHHGPTSRTACRASEAKD